MAASYPMLIGTFLRAMNEIGELGHRKYGEQSFQHRVKTGETARWTDRVQPRAIAGHAFEHFEMYLRGERHDHFDTALHQLAAVAFNAMMEAYLSGATEAEDAVIAELCGQELYDLERTLACEHCASVLDSHCVHYSDSVDGSWLVLTSAKIDVTDEVKYLQARGLLDIHPTIAGLVSVRDEDEPLPAAEGKVR